MNKKLIRNLNIGCFIGVIGILSIGNLLSPDRAYSTNENRTLASRPKVTLSALRAGNFDDAFETWFTDQFVIRDTWIEAKSIIRQATGAIENNDVYYASDDRLIRAFQTYDQKILDQNLDIIQSFLDDHQLNATIIPVPTAAYGQRDSLPYGAYNIDEPELIGEIQQYFSTQTVLDLSSLYDGSTDNYYHTDHHWNAQGSYLAYQLIAEEVLHTSPHTFTFEQVSDNFGGTMLSRSGVFYNKRDIIEKMIPDENIQVTVTYDNKVTTDTLFVDSHLSDKDQYPYYLDGNHPEVHITTSVTNGKKALIIKDSFAHILVPYLAMEYEEIEMIDLRYYHNPVSALIDEETDIYFIYSLDNLCADTSLAFLR